MADAIPVNQDEAPKSTKKATANISPDVLAELKEQLREELVAELKPQAPSLEPSDSTFRVKGGKKLESHDAHREDH